MIRTIAASACVAIVMGFSVSAVGALDENSKTAPEERPSYTFQGLPEPGEVRRYKGHILVGSAKENANNDKFFVYMAKVIDLAEELPESLRRGADLIHLIAYDPPNEAQPQAQQASDRTIQTGEYRVGGDDKSMGAFVVTRDVTWIPPIKVAYAFVDASLNAKLHRNLLTLAERLKQHQPGTTEFHALNKKHKLIDGLLTKSNKYALEKFQCEPLRAQYQAMKAWNEDKLKVDNQRRRLVAARCTFQG